MRTELLPLASHDPAEPGVRQALQRAAGLIRAGGLVAFPTETVYGLGADALDAAATAAIFTAKARALNDPLIVHVDAPDLDALGARGVIGPLTARQRQRARRLIDAFWPGPLTLVLPRGARVPATVTAGGDSVAVRMPRHPIALALIAAAGTPIAAPSANRFGHVSPTTAAHVRADLDGRIDLILDGGPTDIGVESTVVDLREDAPRLLRPGGAAREDIEAALGQPLLRPEARRVAASPGLLDKHYAPRAALRSAQDLDGLRAIVAEERARGQRVGALLNAHDLAALGDPAPAYCLGDTLEAVARGLYAGLRALDAAGVDVIIHRSITGPGLAEALADRLRRAAAR